MYVIILITCDKVGKGSLNSTQLSQLLKLTHAVHPSERDFGHTKIHTISTCCVRAITYISVLTIHAHGTRSVSQLLKAIKILISLLSIPVRVVYPTYPTSNSISFRRLWSMDRSP